MKKIAGAFLAFLLIIILCVGCSHNAANTNAKTKDTKTAANSCKSEHKHKAVHGGSLNAIVTCENGHAEVAVNGDKLQMWFVGGGPDTDKSIRVPDKSITLNIKTSGGAKTLVLSPKPLELAGEKVGDCSYFEGTAAWLKGISKFNASSNIIFKGKKMPLKIVYPDGYDPD